MNEPEKDGDNRGEETGQRRVPLFEKHELNVRTWAMRLILVYLLGVLAAAFVGMIWRLEVLSFGLRVSIIAPVSAFTIVTGLVVIMRSAVPLARASRMYASPFLAESAAFLMGIVLFFVYLTLLEVCVRWV